MKPDLVADDVRNTAVRDHKRVQLVLRVGLAIACVLMAIGTLIEAARGNALAIRATPLDVVSGGFTAQRMILLGIVALALTPAVRVIALIFTWSRERDWRFVAVAVWVALTLALAIAFGRAG